MSGQYETRIFTDYSRFGYQLEKSTILIAVFFYIYLPPYTTSQKIGMADFIRFHPAVNHLYTRDYFMYRQV